MVQGSGAIWPKLIDGENVQYAKYAVRTQSGATIHLYGPMDEVSKEIRRMSNVSM